ncbi:MAG: alpha-amylase [Alphaproteobacteria bacterium]|nr:MAG: alpha-amylase [Alphaproteobacteria bacterium]
MNTFYKVGLMAATILSACPLNASAQDMHLHHGNHENHAAQKGHKHNAPAAPLSIMGDHTHKKGEWMVSYRFKHMEMAGNRKGTSSISPEEIVTTIVNPNAPPATLRVVPTKMDMDMHMLSAMYGVSDKLTLMAMAMYMKNDMTHITFAGMAGSTELGRFTTRSSGWGDTSLTGIYNLYETANHNVNISLGLSAPTGSIKEEDDILSPANTTPTLRLPYAMQLGSGTWDSLTAVTYSGHSDKYSWGVQYNGVIRLENKNAQGYRLGDRHTLTGWGGYKVSNQITVNALVSGETIGKIKGADANITAPVQTANPDNYGGKTIELGAGFTYAFDTPSLKGLEFGVEARLPVYQNLNGVQMERDWNITTGLTYRF